jgi:hypothetical protein
MGTIYPTRRSNIDFLVNSRQSNVYYIRVISILICEAMSLFNKKILNSF